MPTTIPALTNSPAAPGPGDGANFGTRAYAFLAWMYGTFGPEMTAVISAINTFGGELSSLSNVILNGTGVPAAGLGVNGNYYIENASGDLYYKASGAWSSTGNIKGPAGISGQDKWTNLVAVTDFSTTAASTSSITMNADKRSEISPGTAIKFTLSNASIYYGICTSIASNAMGIAGAPLATGAGALTALSYGLLPTYTERVQIPGYWADAADTALILNDLVVPYVWRGPKAYLVQIGAYSRTTDSGANKPRLNARRGATTTDYVSTSNSNAGLEIAAAATWYRTVVDIDSAKYAVNFGDTIELKTDGNGGNDDAADLTAELVFVWE